MTIRKKDYDRPIYQNATVVMRPTTPLNTQYIELNPGGPPAPELPEYGVLPLGQSTSPIQIDEPLAHLDESTRNAARELLTQADVALARAPRDLPGGVQAIAGFTKSLQPIAAQLDVRRDKVRQLITSLGIVAKTLGTNDVRLTQLADRLQVTLGAVASQNDALRDSFNQLPGVADRLRESTASVQGLADQLDPTLDNIREASDTLPGSLNGLTRTVDNLDTTLQKLDPVASKLRPTARDLRPFVSDLNRTFPDLKTISNQLDPVTERLVPYLPDLVAFIYHSDSAISKSDGNLRNSAHALVTAGARCSLPGTCSLPDDGGVIPNTIFGQKLGKNPGTNYGDTTPKYDEFESNGDFVRTAK
jgi:phospholipid/cholesterol/gamma-HCH transport system substrate-binding protein